MFFSKTHDFSRPAPLHLWLSALSRSSVAAEIQSSNPPIAEGGTRQIEKKSQIPWNHILVFTCAIKSIESHPCKKIPGGVGRPSSITLYFPIASLRLCITVFRDF